VNHLNKKIALSALMGLLLTTPAVSYATSIEPEQNSKIQILTYEEAVKIATDESTELINRTLKSESQSISLEKQIDSMGEALLDPQLLGLMKLQKADKLNSQSIERTQSYIKKGLDFKIKSVFNNISTMKKDIAIENEKLANSIAKRNTLALKLEYGMESKTNLTSKDIEINQLKKEIEILEKELDSQYLDLNKMLGFNSFDRYDVEEISFNFTPIKDTKEDVEFKATRAVSSDVSIWAKQQEIDIQRLDVDFYGLNYINGLSSDKQPETTPYKALKIDTKVSANELEQMKEDVRNSVVSKYNSIKLLETNYENTLLKLKDLQEKQRVLEVAIKAGTAIDQDYKDLLLGIKEINNGLEKMENQHSLLVEMYNEPMLAGSSIN